MNINTKRKSMQQHEENLCAKLKESAPGYSEGQHNKTNFAATDLQTITRRDRPQPF